MVKFKKKFSCDVCGENILYPNFRIEWGHTQVASSSYQQPFDFVQVCHENCSYGILNGNSHPVTFGDIIFDQLPYSPQKTEECLDDLAQNNLQLSETIQSIKAKIFE